MPRSQRNTVILAKQETTSGTDAAPTNSADAVLFYADGLTIKIDSQMASRDIVRGYFGAPDMLPVTRRGTISFSCDVASSSALGTAPQWGDLLIGCAMGETVTATTRVEYLPSSSSLKTLTLWAYEDGVLYKFTYCAGSVRLRLRVGETPRFEFTFTGLVTDPTAAAVPAATITAWQRPLAVSTTATTGLTLGGTYSAGAITGGTQYGFQEAVFDLGNDVQDLILTTQETVAVYGRSPTCEVTLDMTAAQLVTQHTNMKAGTTTSVGLVQGTASPGKVLVYAPTGVITSVDDVVQGNVLLAKLSMTLTPGSAGNDELRIVAI